MSSQSLIIIWLWRKTAVAMPHKATCSAFPEGWMVLQLRSWVKKVEKHWAGSSLATRQDPLYLNHSWHGFVWPVLKRLQGWRSHPWPLGKPFQQWIICSTGFCSCLNCLSITAIQVHDFLSYPMWTLRLDHSLPLFGHPLCVIGKILLHLFSIFPTVKRLFSYFSGPETLLTSDLFSKAYPTESQLSQNAGSRMEHGSAFQTTL